MVKLIGKDTTAVALHQLGSVEILRSGAYCNLNDIAKPFSKKRVDNWMRLKSTTELLKAFSSDPSYGGSSAILKFSGNLSASSDLRKHLELFGIKDLGKGGTWGHPDIAIQFAQWCSPGFALWVSRQIRYLLTYGEVNLHYREWSYDEYERGVEFNRQDARELYRK